MVERRITLIISVLLIAVVAAGALGYGVGRFVTPPERLITTTTRVSTSLVTVTERLTTTSTVSGDLPPTFPPPANSTAVIRGRFYFNGAIFMTFSIDKPTYSIGETVHMKSTITNLSPNDMSFLLGSGEPMIDVLNSKIGWVWVYPEFAYAFYLFPLSSVQMDVPAGETKTIPWMTADWNMRGLHRNGAGNVTDYYIPWNNTGISLKGDFYNDHFVSEGQYTVEWPVGIRHLASERWPVEFSRETIPFTNHQEQCPLTELCGVRSVLYSFAVSEHGGVGSVWIV